MMFTGFDFGTSNCAMGVMDGHNSVRLLPLEDGKTFMPSALYALDRELICEQVGLNIQDAALKETYIGQRGGQLARARQVRREEGFAPSEQSLYVGKAGFEQYLADPREGYFIKSPKSFLGASGLRPEAVAFFEDIVTAMMQAIKQKAEALTGQNITHTVIGRPVNFQGLNSELSNKQALDILRIAGQRAGFQHVEFLFEPIAAGLNFEAQLENEKTVLVVDVGGGTTDCAMVRMGPAQRDKLERSADFLGHSGERIGGNDLDIQLAGQHLMPLFGMQSSLKNGLHMPTKSFWDAVRTNDVGAQALFYDKETGFLLNQLLLDCSEPHLIKRFIKLRNDKQNYHLVRSAEQAKIALSSTDLHNIDLAYIEAGLATAVGRDDFASAIERPLQKMTDLMDEAVKQAGCLPDLIFITGGSAQSPVLRQAIEQKLGKIPVLDGDHFGSVTAGLTRWAGRIFA